MAVPHMGHSGRADADQQEQQREPSIAQRRDWVGLIQKVRGDTSRWASISEVSAL